MDQGRPRDLRGRPVAVLVAVILAVQATLAGWLALDSTRATDDRLGPRLEALNESGVQLTIESGASLALERLRDAGLDGALIAASQQVDWPETEPLEVTTELPPGGWLTYAFVLDGGDSDEVYSIFLERSIGLVVDERRLEWSTAPPDPLDLGSISVSSTVAALAAELSGGNAFRRACPEQRGLTRLALAWDGDALVWMVSYVDQATGDLGLRVTIDATTGDVGEIENRDLSC
jgi:hypothetical protein